ncbi:shikimate dehydrogenase [Leifsonia bigeumensis]|uniref:Shikimate dehydrogenase n=1 Tax=Leifsonella bigeumensis TaxID=433643 RepID=A0ABP7FVY6_9MICO
MKDPVRKLAVLGSPIAHSRSPALHRAAYRVLGLPWEYGSAEVASGELGGFLSGLDDSWRGLSLTMPLKREILPLLGGRDAVTDLVGAANTVLFDDGRVLGFNTDVYGAEMMLAECLPGTLRRALILGSGATASSMLAALARRGVEEVVVAARTPENAGGLITVADRLGVAIAVGGFDTDPGAPDVVVSTLPGTAESGGGFSQELRSSVPLVDIAYDPWPSAVAGHWLEAGGVVNSGLGMLIHQAIAQVRIFVGGDPGRVLPDEEGVLAAMREAALGRS